MNKDVSEKEAMPPILVAFAVFIPFAAGYFLSYLYRSVNAIIAPNLVGAFDLSAADLGLLTSFYFLTFAALQIPVGLMLDRFGPRKTNGTLLIVAAMGGYLFSVASGLTDLIVARALIGFGVAAGLMSSIKVFTMWFPLSKLPLMNGLIFCVGGLGAISATVPVEYLLQFTDWRGVFRIIAAATVAASLMIFIFVPEKAKENSSREGIFLQLKGVAEVYRSPFFWQIAAASTILSALNMAVQTLWAAPWLFDVAKLDREQVAFCMLGLGASTMAGFLFWGALASRLARYDISTIAVFRVGAALFLLLQFFLIAGVKSFPYLIWIAFGFLGTCHSLVYSALSQKYPMHLTGRVNTALNLLVFLTVFAIQWIFGLIVNMWPTDDGGYQPLGYSISFGVFVSLQLLGLLWIAIRPVKEI